MPAGTSAAHERVPLYEQISHNKRKTATLLAALIVPATLVVGGILFVIGIGPLGFAVALVIACAAAYALYVKADAVVVAKSRAVVADELTYARLHNLIEGLCISSGLPKPRVYVVDDTALNAFAAGRSPKHALIVVTTGLVTTLNRVELEGVLAHELSHIKNFDILPSTVAAATISAFVFPPLMNAALHATVGEHREELADIAGVSMTRYPPGLIAALEKLHANSTAVAASSANMAHLWIAEPSAAPAGDTGVEPSKRSAANRPPITERIERLREL